MKKKNDRIEVPFKEEQVALVSGIVWVKHDDGMWHRLYDVAGYKTSDGLVLTGRIDDKEPGGIKPGHYTVF